MPSILLLIFSLLLFSACGKHQQETQGRQGTGNTNTITSLEALSQDIVDENIPNLEKYVLSGGDLNSELKNGRTFLTEACFWLKFKVIGFLVAKKVSLDLKDRSGRSPLDYGEESIIIKRALFPELLIELKRSLFLAVKNNNISEMKKILEEKPPVNFILLGKELNGELEDNEGETLLTFCVKKKLENVLRLLAQPKYELNVNLKNDKGESPLALARAFKFSNIEKLLIRLGATE